MSCHVFCFASFFAVSPPISEHASIFAYFFANFFAKHNWTITTHGRWGKLLPIIWPENVIRTQNFRIATPSWIKRKLVGYISWVCPSWCILPPVQSWSIEARSAWALFARQCYHAQVFSISNTPYAPNTFPPSCFFRTPWTLLEAWVVTQSSFFIVFQAIF